MLKNVSKNFSNALCR